MSAKDIVKYQFKKGQSGNPKGRPPNRVPSQLVKIFGSKATAAKFYNLSGDEVDSWEQAVLSMTVRQLTALAKWDETPVYPKGLAVSIINDMKNGTTKTLDKLRERQYGAVRKALDITSNGKELKNDPLVVEIIDSREQVDNSEQDEEAEQDEEE